MDKSIVEFGKKEWEEIKEKECKRAYETCVRLLKTPLTYEEFTKVWYSEHADKAGKNHIANMCMSIFQSRKSTAGNSFESAIKHKHTELGIRTLYQVYVDSEGKVYTKKPTVSCHKVDALIPLTEDETTIKDMIVVSKKTTARERWRQDLDCIGKCKQVIFLTKHNLKDTLLNSITGYGIVVVTPNSKNTNMCWSYDKYFSEMKRLQQT